MTLQSNEPLTKTPVTSTAPQRTRFWRDYSIYTKLGIAFGLVLVLMALLTYGSVFLANQQRAITQNAFTSEEQVRLTREIQTEFDLARQMEKEFLLRYSSMGINEAEDKYGDPVRDQIDQVRFLLSDLQNLQEQGETIEDQHLVDIESMRTDLNGYETTFETLVEKVKIRGLDDSGMVLDMETKIEALEETNTVQSDFEMYVLLLQMRQSEKNWFLNGQFNDANAASNIGNRIKERILTLASSDQQKIVLTALVSDYLSKFNEVVDADVQIRGLRNDLNTTGDIVSLRAEGLVDTEVSRANSLRDQSDQLDAFTTPFQLIVPALGIAAGIILAYIASRGLSRPIHELTAITSRFAAGDLTARAAVKSKDEVGVLAGTFNTMADRLRGALSGMERRLEDLSLAAEVGQAIAEIRDLGTLLQQIVELMRSRYDLYYAQVYMPDESGRSLILRAGTGAVGAELVRRGHRLVVGPGSINGRSAAEKRAVIVSDTTKSETFLANPLLPGTRSEMAIPLLLGDRLVGVLNLQDANPGTFTEESLAGFESLAGQLAVAINNATAYAQLQVDIGEAEERIRRQSQGNWQQFLQTYRSGTQFNFLYDKAGLQTAQHEQVVQGGVHVPIVVSGAEVGRFHLTMEDNQSWTEVDADFVSTVADQVARQIESLRLVAEAEQSRHEAEEATRQLTVEGWRDYLQVTETQGLGYAFDQNRVISITDGVYTNGDESTLPGFSQPITVRGEVVAMLSVSPQPNEVELDPEAAALLRTVAERLGAHIETLRLTDQTRRALVDLQASEQQLTETMQIAQMASWEFDMRQMVFTYNDQYYRLIGATPQEFGGYMVSIDDFLRKIVHPDDGKKVQEELKKALQARQANYSGELEFRVRTRKGETRHALFSYRLEMGAGNRPIRAIGSQLDITERKAAEEAVRESRERFAIAVEGSNDGIWDWNVVTNEVYFSPRWKAMIGYTDDELENKFNVLESHIHPEDHDWVMRSLQDYLEQKASVYDVEFRMRHKDEDFVWVRARGLALRDDQGAPLRMAGSHSDITEQKQAEQELAKRALELQTVAEVSTAAATVLEAQELLSQVVDLTKERFGLYHAHIYLLDEETDTLVLAAGAGEVGRRMVAQDWRIPLIREQSLVARTARTRKGIIVNDVRSEPGFLANPDLPNTRAELAVPIMSGDLVAGVLDVQSDKVDYFTDVDVRIQSTLAAQIGVALQNARLYAVQAATVARLQEMDYLKTAFLANMSHELRTPLNSIIGFTEVIMAGLDGPLTITMEEDLTVIHKNGQHLLQLINEVLDMAKIEAGKMTLMYELIDLREIINDVVNTSLPLANERELNLTTEMDPEDVLHFEGDFTRIRQVLLNLVNNALKFTNEGNVDVRAWKLSENLIRVDVRDTGIGIPEEYLDKIFESFSQVDTSSTRKAGGTGLGLPISRQLIELHHGKLWVESGGLGSGGSVFHIELPVRQPVRDTTLEDSMIPVDGQD